MNTQIPIYRAKKINSDEYVDGYLHSGITIASLVGISESDPFRTATMVSLIDPSTLAINFPNWICSDIETDEEVKVFASLQKDKKGGSEVEIRDNFQGANGTLYFNGEALMFQGMNIEYEMLQAFQVTGIQQ